MIPDTHATVGELLPTVIGKRATESLLDKFESGEEVLRALDLDLRKVVGIGPRTIKKIAALRGITKCMVLREATAPRLYVTGPEDVADMFSHEMRALDREHFRVILVNTKNRILGVRTISIGSLNGAIVHAREVFKAAIAESAQAIILVHNHPSGLPEPSSEDIVMTERLAECGRIVGIEVLDHIILGTKGFVSLKELGHL